MSFDRARAAILRTLSCHEAWGYAPTQSELLLTLDDPAPHGCSEHEVLNALQILQIEGLVQSSFGRFAHATQAEQLVDEVVSRDRLQPRKRGRAQSVARWLARLSGVRFVALANTTAMGYARDFGDLDFFVIVRAGSIWNTRLLSAGVFKLLGRLPKTNETRDAVCLSYFISDDQLDLTSHMLPGHDPYFHQWFLQLMPLVDDGVSIALWQANTAIRSRHPFARRWLCPPDLEVAVPTVRIPCGGFMEPLSRLFQSRWFPAEIRERMNTTTEVIVTDQALKFHVEDGRENYRERCITLCRERGVQL